MFENDGAEAHGKRLADWIIEQLGGEGKPWTESGREGMRFPSHRKAWNNPKRDKWNLGDPFTMVDVMRWMCVFFRTCRECGFDKHEPFFKFYVNFIGHVGKIYDLDAPVFA